jgi:hypothetical protein
MASLAQASQQMIFYTRLEIPDYLDRNPLFGKYMVILCP